MLPPPVDLLQSWDVGNVGPLCNPPRRQQRSENDFSWAVRRERCQRHEASCRHGKYFEYEKRQREHDGVPHGVVQPRGDLQGNDRCRKEHADHGALVVAAGPDTNMPGNAPEQPVEQACYPCGLRERLQREAIQEVEDRLGEATRDLVRPPRELRHGDEQLRENACGAFAVGVHTFVEELSGVRHASIPIRKIGPPRISILVSPVVRDGHWWSPFWWGCTRIRTGKTASCQVSFIRQKLSKYDTMCS